MADINTTTQQSLFDYAEIKSNFPSASEQGLDDYSAKGRDIIRLFILANSLIPLDGVGSPEGIAESNFSKMYIDTNANQLYFNPIVGANTGWVAL